MCGIVFRILTFRFTCIFSMLFSEGFKEAAEKFRMESGVQPPVDPDTLDPRIEIREAIQKGDIEQAIALVNDLHPELLDNDRYLYFHLQVLSMYHHLIIQYNINNFVQTIQSCNQYNLFGNVPSV